MSRLTDMLVIAGFGIAAAGASAVLTTNAGRAADHVDPPTRTDIRFDPTPDVAADVADIFAWTDATSLNLIFTFAGPASKTQPATYDPRVIYRIHLSTAGRPDDDEYVIETRFGHGTGGDGVRVVGLPGQTQPLIGPVETILRQDGNLAFAGLIEDPFFFDVLGFRQTLATGTISMLNTRDFFADQNDTAIAFQIPIDRVARDTNGNGRPDSRIDVWIDSYRKGGQL